MSDSKYWIAFKAEGDNSHIRVDGFPSREEADRYRASQERYWGLPKKMSISFPADTREEAERVAENYLL